MFEGSQLRWAMKNLSFIRVFVCAGFDQGVMVKAYGLRLRLTVTANHETLNPKQ